MNNLLHANIERLWKNKLFWFGSLFMLLYGIFKMLTEYKSSVKLGEDLNLDDILFVYAFITGIISAIFVSFFAGTEYSDGTIRNKIIVGHARFKVYLSNLITNILAVSFMCFIYILVILVAGTPLLGSLRIEISQALKIIFSSFLLITSYCSIYTFFSMLCHNKAISVAICVVASFLSLFTEAYIGSMLSLPDYYTGVKRTVLGFLFNYLPSGQAYQYMSMQFGDLNLKMLCLAAISCIATITGMVFFQKKDIK